MEKMFCLVRIQSAYDFYKQDIIECSEDLNNLQNKRDEYNSQKEYYLTLISQFQDWETRMITEWQNRAYKFVKLEKCPNKKSDGSNKDLWNAITKKNEEKIQEARKIFCEEYVQFKVPEKLRIFFNPEFIWNTLWCTRFEVIETKNHPWRK